MSPKGKKSSNNSWYTCEACNIILAFKDVQQHSLSCCPPDDISWEHAFIKDNVLFGFIDNFNNEDDPKLTVQYEHSIVYLSQSAMQVCSFEIGEQVALVVNDNYSMVRTVWPTTKKTLTSVILPTSDPANKNIPSEDSRIKVQKLSRKPLPASIIHLTPCVEISLNCFDQLLVLCKQLFIGKVLKTNSEMYVPFYGKSVSLIIKDIIPYKCETEDFLVHDLRNLNINKNFPEETYFLVVESSNWEISQNVSKKDTEPNRKEVCLNDVGGYKKLVQELMRTISLVIKKNDSSFYLSNSLGILLYGPSGVGKTFITQAIVNEMHVNVVKINSGELFSKFYGESETRLRNLFTEAKNKSPSIIIFDNVDTICPKRAGTEQERRVIAYLLTLIDSLRGSRTVVLATTSQLNLIDTSFRRPGRFDCEIELPIPSVTDRYEILKVLFSNWNIEDSDLMNVASAAHGYVAADLQCLVTKSVMQATSLNKTNIDIYDIYWALSKIKPSAMREVLVQVPNVKWTDIGGLDDLKLKLQQAIEWPLQHPESFARLGIKPPRGVLMYGPPGCSKTMIAKALATESKLNFLSIKGSELFSKWVGESEKAVQSLFSKARAVAPSIIFLDELDALGGERSESSEGNNVQERVLAQLLTEMDGVEPLGNVNIVAATNRPDRIDKALLRPGRLDRMVYVPLPDLATRICILQLQLVKMPVADDIVIDDLALKTEGYSGAEIIAVCHEAAINALQEDFNINEICERHFVFALSMVKPRTPQSLLKLYDTYLNS